MWNTMGLQMLTATHFQTSHLANIKSLTSAFKFSHNIDMDLLADFSSLVSFGSVESLNYVQQAGIASKFNSLSIK
jgi:hypothetical protein